jgi:hypothetical protein
MTLQWFRIISLLAVLTAAGAAAAGDMPQDQKKFIQIVEHYNRAYTQADSAIAKNATRVQRAKAICDAMRTPLVQNWTGTVLKVWSTREGKGILSVELSTEISVATANDSITDIGHNTLIDPKSSLFDQAILLKTNQQVLFSGSFLPDSTDCLTETSTTLSGSMAEFLFRFSDVSPLPYQVAPHFPRGD